MADALQVDGINEHTSIFELILLCIPFFVAVFSALRLAKFNIDENQTTSFIGLPTPANAILIASLPAILWFYDYPILQAYIKNEYFLVGFVLLQSYLLVSKIPMFSLKFSNYKFADNKIRFIFLAISIILIASLQLLSIPIIIFLYIAISLFSSFKIANTKS